MYFFLQSKEFNVPDEDIKHEITALMSPTRFV